MTPSSIDGYSLERWLDFFEIVRADPQGFCDVMSLDAYPPSHRGEAGLWQLQIDLRKRVSRKFVEPQRWIWSQEYLQLASDQKTAEMVASYYPAQCRVFDIGCGGGSDAIALAQNRPVVAIDKNEFACRLAMCNAQLQSNDLTTNMEARCCSAEDLTIGKGCYLHIDPDRRQDGLRSVRMQWHSPNLETVRRLIDESEGGGNKVGTRLFR